MVNYPRWAIITTVVIALLGLIYASPNFFPQADETVETSGLLPSNRMNLGLDLQGSKCDQNTAGTGWIGFLAVGWTLPFLVFLYVRWRSWKWAPTIIQVLEYSKY